MTLTIPVLSKVPNLVPELVKILPAVRFHEVKTPDDDPVFRNSEILVCDFDLLSKHVDNLPKAKWVQGTWAGVEKLTAVLTKPPNFQVTRFTGDHFGRLMAEYVIANLVQHERSLFQVEKNQKIGAWDKSNKISNYRSIYDLTIGILGIGNIGNQIGQILHFMGAKILAFGRRDSLPKSEEYSHITQYYTRETLPLLLKGSDYVVNVLPKTVETDRLLENDIIENCKEKQSVFINIGRSNVLSEASLIKSLDNNWLSAAILDVFDAEPLPKNNILWKHEKIFITPHVAGNTRAKDVAERFKSNLDLYLNGLELPALVDFAKGY